MTLLSVERIDAAYGDVQVLFDVSLSVEKGETVALLGANGAGKTTTLRAISGTLSPSSGAIYFREEPITEFSPHVLVGRGLVHVPEGREMFAESTVRENLRLGAYGTREGWRERLSEVLDLFPRLDERLGQRAGTLSGGEQGMLAIARGLMSDPDLLLLDEASLGLAPILVEDVFATIERIKETGRTVLLVEQDVHNALAVADRGYVLESGRITLSGSADELAGHERLEAAYLGG